MRISMPPSRRALELDFVHEVADEEDAAAAALQQVLRRQRIGDLLGIEALRPGRGRESSSRAPPSSAVSNSTNTRLDASCWLPCLMALMTHSRIATPTQCDGVLVEPDVAADVAADDLDEIDHLERARELEADAAAAAWRPWTPTEYHPIC